ncbi:MAG TPA: YbhB/YbcL family Raf kinase inhibitor-like protein [Bryobacteraceae bacterium]|nr:YbhB/YbcL family Raf kinase inhibitor-like protein [Bryobacteraceae bacterium]
MAFNLMINAFPEGAVIPKLHTCEGADISPALEWRDAPENTRSFALVVDDPDAPSGVWNHWLLYDIPVTAHAFPQGWKPSAAGVSGTNDFGKPGYNGPCPPRGHGPHRYIFKLFALGVPSLGLPPGAKRAGIDKAMRGHILAETEYMGVYERR